jgi:phage/plasmid primase-like uncharacterized protein
VLLPLTDEKRWVNWRWQLRQNKSGKSKWTKPPLRPDDLNYAHSDDPATWGDYEQAVRNVQRGKADGIGYMLLGSHIGAIDLDDCCQCDAGARKVSVEDWARELRREANGTYCELTVSGTGARLIGISSGGEKVHRRFALDGDAGIELFRNAERFITVSGLQFGNCAQLMPIDDLIETVLARYDNLHNSQASQAPDRKAGALFRGGSIDRGGEAECADQQTKNKPHAAERMGSEQDLSNQTEDQTAMTLDRNVVERNFVDAMRSAGLVLSKELIADGHIHRCDVEGKGWSGKGDGSYMLHLGANYAAGGFQNWTDRRGWQKWVFKRPGWKPTAAEQREIEREIEQARSEAEKEKIKRQAEAREKANGMWENAEKALPSFPYCQRKQVKPYGLQTYRFKGGEEVLLVPMSDDQDRLVNLQMIHSDGTKRFLSGGRKQGCHFWVARPGEKGDNSKIICIVEGCATGETVCQATGYATVVAFDGGNLQAVAEWVRKQYPDHEIIVCADDDWKTEGNPGLSYARAAARAVNGKVAVPVFGEQRGEKDTDFNDMLVAAGTRNAGLDAVEDTINTAVAPDEIEETQAQPSNSKDDVIARMAVLKLSDRIAYDQARKQAAKDLDIRTGTLDQEVDKRITAMKTEKQQEVAAPDVEELAEAAADIIECDNVLGMFAEDFSRVIAGEEATAKLIYLGATSRLFAKTMHLAIKGPSSVGKSAARKRVLDFFPPEDVIGFTAFSEKALLYMRDDFAHKVLSMGEAYSAEEVKFQDYLLRELMSEGRLVYYVPMKTEDGRIETVTIEKNGPVAFIVTTTRHALNPENETRMLSLEVDDSAEQTRRVVDKVAVVEGFNRQPEKADFAPWHAFQRWLRAGECRVLIPWVQSLSALIEVTKSVRLRRDFSQLLCAVKAHALLHREQRERSSKGEVVATIKKDYAAVYVLMRDLLASTAEMKVHKRIMETVKAVQDEAAQFADDDRPPFDFPGATVRQMADRMKLDRSAAWRRLKAAEYAGFIVNREEREKRPARYAATDEPLVAVRELLPTPEALAQHRMQARERARRRTQGSTFSRAHPTKNAKNVQQGEASA